MCSSRAIIQISGDNTTVARGTASGSKEVFTAGAGSNVLGVMTMDNNEGMGVTVVT